MNWQTARAWVYRASAFLGFVYVVIGVVRGELSYDDLSAAIGTLVSALAAANTPTKVVANGNLDQ